MLYVAGLQQRLTVSGLGFDLSYMEEGITNIRHIPALFYADAIVLLANNPDELQDLLNICGEESTKLGFTFSVRKSAVMTYGPAAPLKTPELSIQGKPLAWTNEYKYLGYQSHLPLTTCRAMR